VRPGSGDLLECTQLQHHAALGRIAFEASIDAVEGVDLAIEAVPENLALKRDVLVGADERMSADGILASNTSSISITEIELR